MPELIVHPCADFVIAEMPRSGSAKGNAESLQQELARIKQLLPTEPFPHIDMFLLRLREALPERPNQS